MFKKVMYDVLERLQFAMVYVDGVIMLSRILDEHVGYCQEVFESIRKAKLNIKVKDHLGPSAASLTQRLTYSAMSSTPLESKGHFGSSYSEACNRAQEFSPFFQILSSV